MRCTSSLPSRSLCAGRKWLQFASVSFPCRGVALRNASMARARPSRATDAWTRIGLDRSPSPAGTPACRPYCERLPAGWRRRGSQPGKTPEPPRRGWSGDSRPGSPWPPPPSRSRPRPQSPAGAASRHHRHRRPARRCCRSRRHRRRCCGTPGSLGAALGAGWWAGVASSSGGGGRRRRRRRRRRRDLHPGRRQGGPAAPEGNAALPVRVAGLLIADEGVERVAVVGDLLRSVGPAGGSDQGGVRPLARRRGALRRDGRPGGGARPRAGARRPRSAPNKYTVRPCESTKMFPRPLLPTASVGARAPPSLGGGGRWRGRCARAARAACGSKRNEQYGCSTGDKRRSGSAVGHW